MLAVVCPGQGAQTPGLLAAWLDDPAAAALLEGALDPALLALGVDSDAAAIRPTEVAQPLVVATSLAGAAALAGSSAPSGGSGPLPVAAMAGHSVGEWAAAVLAGVLDAATALRLVRVRADAMAAAAAGAPPSGMAAVLGGDLDEVLGALDRHGLTAANRNGAGQVVAAGLLTGLDALLAVPPAGTRVRRLDVAAAFHTPLMARAVPPLAAAVAGVTPADPTASFIGNAAGEVLRRGAVVLTALTAQVTAPVRWDLCLQTLGRLGVTAVLELPPAGVLTPLVRRALPGVATLALRSPADLDAARAFVLEHGAPLPAQT